MKDKYTVTLRDTTFPSGIKSSLIAYIDGSETLVIDGYDTGNLVEKLWGDSDYEYWIKVIKPEAQKVLLQLIKDRFTEENDFKKWLEEKKIKYTFESWI